MATVTATTTIKFADTLDITLLTPEQIAKFVDKDFAAFSTQQQADLTAEQVKLLTAKQLALLPTKLLEPETIAAIDPKVIAGLFDPKLVSVFNVKSLSADQFSSLTSEQLKSIPALQFADLTTAQADLLTDTQAAVLTADQISNLSAKAVGALTATTVEALPITAIPGFTAKNIIGLTTDTITALTIEQAAALGSKQVSALTPLLVREMELDDVAALSTAAMRGFTTKNIISLSLSALTSEQFGALASKQVASLTTAQLESLNSEFAPLLTSKAIGAMSSAQIGVLSTDVVAALEPLAVKGFNAKNIKGLTTSQVASITADQAVNLSRVQLKALASDQVGALNVDSVLAIKPIIFKGLSGALMENLAPTVFSSFSDEQIANLTSTHIASLQSTQVAALSGSQLAGMKPTAIAGLTTTGIQGITTDAVSSLTALQLAKFSTASAGQLESFTPAQAAKLSDDVKTWLATKNYATVQSAETNTTGTKGIYTSGTTIAGETVAETITGTSGADVISTGGTTGDKISTGKGNDTITLTSVAAGHTHTVDGGEGTADELILPTAAFYTSSDFTNVSNIEKVTLSTDGNESLDLSGTTNTFATVDISALTDAKTLTLTGSYATNKVAVSFDEGDLDASGYTGLGLNVTATTGTNIIKTGTGSDSIDGGAANDTITAGAGVDTITGGADADTFVFAAGANGATPTSTVFDTITDFLTGADVIDFGTTEISISPVLTTATQGTAQILPTGKAVFHDLDDTLAERVTAVVSALGSGVAGETVLFTDINNTDAYVFVSDGTATAGANDVLIKLAGKGTAAESLGAKAGDISSLTSLAANTDLSSASYTAADIIHIKGTGTEIFNALTTATTGLLANIDKIDSITATSGTVALTPAQFATAGVAAALSTGSATVNATTPTPATQAQLTAIVDNITKIKAGGIDGTSVPFTAAQFATTGVATALHDGVATVVATGATTGVAGTSQTEILVANAAKLAAGGITGTIVLTPTEFATSGVVTALAANTATVAVTSPTSTQVASLFAGATKIKDGGIAVTTGMSVTDTQFATLASKITASATVTVNATDATAAEVITIVDNISKIAATGAGLGITGTGIALTAAQFSAIHAKLATGVTVTVDATGATATELATLSTGVTNSQIAEITNLTITSEQAVDANSDGDTTDAGDLTATTTLITNLLSKVQNGTAQVVATDLTSTQVAALATNVAKIATSGITAPVTTVLGSSTPITEEQFATLLSKFGTNVTVDINADASSFANLKLISDNIDKVHSITNLGNSSPFFVLGTDIDTTTTVGAARITANNTITENLLSKAVAAKVDALNATATELTSVYTHIGNIGTLTNSTSSVNAAQFVSLQSSLPTGMLIDATGATAAELTYIYANQTKVGSITNLTLNLGSQTQAEIDYLLSKASTGTVRTDITGANLINGAINYAQLLAENASKFATGGLTGTGLTLTDTQFAALGTKFATSVTDVTVVANGTSTAINGGTEYAVVGATAAELAIISDNIARVGLVTNLTVTAATQTDTATSNLLSKAFALDAQVVADGASTNEVASIVSNISRIAASGISTTTNALEVTPTQFVTLSTKLAAAVTATGVNTVTVDATGATAAQLTAMAPAVTDGGNHASVIKNLTTTSAQSDADVVLLLAKATGTNAVVASSTTLTATQFNDHQVKLASTTAITVDAGNSGAAAPGASSAELVVVSDNINNVASITNLQLTSTNSIGGASFTDAVTNNLLSKAAAGTATVLATSATEAEIDSMVTYAANILSTTGITGTLTVTDTQFATLYPKLNSTAIVTVNAAGATLAELQTISAQNALVDTVTNAVVNTSTLTDTETDNLLSKSLASTTGKATVLATGATTAEVTSVVTNIANVADYGITGALTVVNGNFSSDALVASLFTKYVGTTATADIASMATGKLTNLAAAAGKIASGGITNSGAAQTMTDTQFASLGAKLNNSVVDMVVNADGATSAEIIAINADIDNIASLTDVGAAAQTFDATGVSSTDTLALVGKAAASGIVTVTNFSGAALTGTVVPYNISLGTNTSTDITLAAGAVNDTVNVGSLTLLAASNIDSGAGVDTLVVKDGANIAAATIDTNFTQLTFDATGVSGTNDLTISAAQHTAFTGTVTAAGTGSNGEKITVTTALTDTGFASVENYVLQAASTFTLGAAAQNVTFAAGTTNTVDVTTLTATGTFSGLTSDDTVVMATGSSISGINSGAVTGAGIVTIAASANVSMTPTQHAGFTTFTDAATQTITLTSAATALALNANIETYVLASATNTATLGAAAQSVTTTGGTATINTAALTPLTGTFDVTNTVATLAVAADATISGATMTGWTAGNDAITLANGVDVTATIAQNALITTGTGTNIVTLSAAGTTTGAAEVESYVLFNGANTFTLGAANQNVTGDAGNDTVLTGSFSTVSGTLVGAAGTNTLQVNDNATFSGTLTDTWIISVDAAKTLTTTAAKATGVTITGAGSVAITALDATLAADLSTIVASGGITAAFSNSGTFTGNLGTATTTVAATKTLTAAASVVTGETINGTGTVAITALDATLAADLSTITATTVTAAFDNDGTFTGNLGTAIVTVAATKTLTAAASVVTGETIGGTGTVAVTALASTTNLSNVTATTVTATVTADLDISVNTNLTTVDTYTLSEAADLTVVPSQVSAATLAITGTTGGSVEYLKVAGTASADTIDLSSITFTDSGASVTGGALADVITLDTTSTADVVVIGATDSTTAAYDSISNWTTGTTAAAKDKLDLVGTPTIAGNNAGGAGAGIVTSGASSIGSHSIASGLIVFDADATYGTPLTLSSADDLTAAINYVVANITTDGETVMFDHGSDTYVFQNNTAGDVLVKLTGVQTTTLETTATTTDLAVFIG